MKTKTEPTIKVPAIIAAVVLLVGCTSIIGAPALNECELDSDCGQAYCSENFRKLVSSTCVEGKCVEDVTECDESEICVQDSRGVRCEEKEPPKQTLSCCDNSKTTFLSGQNPFHPTDHICGDDCPVGFNCNDQCICECPDPVFTDNYWGNAPQVDLDFDTLHDQWKNDPEGLLGIVGLINIPAYVHVRDGATHFIPFPEVQLTLVPNPDNEYITKEGWEAYCVNDYYDGEKALDIDLELLTRQNETCYWGGTVGFEGVLSVCPEDLINWLRGYLAQ